MLRKTDNGDAESYSSSLRLRVFIQLEEDILNGKYRPGESLIEKELCEEMGVSRTPLREALRQLEREGLVQSIPNKGVIVRGISTKDIEDIYTIRMMIEGLAARWAAEKITPEGLAELEEAVELEEFYTSKNDADHLLRFDTQFHDVLYKASKSKPLIHMLSMFHHYVQSARTTSMAEPDRALKVLEEHKAILQAVKDRDSQRAERLTTEHVRNAGIHIISQIRSNETKLPPADT